MTDTTLHPQPTTNGTGGITTEVVLVTPSLAEAWLASNVRNRRFQPDLAAKYARDMAAGNWLLTGEAIKFDAAGKLDDGQHRLSGVVIAGVPAPMLVVRGLAAGVQDVLDSGRKRTAADALYLRGNTDVNVTAAAANLALAWTDGKLKKAGQTTPRGATHSELIAFLDLNPELPAAVGETSKWRNKIQAKASVLAFTYWATHGIDPEDAVLFYTDLADMRTDGAGDPRYSLLRRLAAVKDNRERSTPVAESFYIFRTWNALRKQERLSNLKIGNVHGYFDFVDPV